MALIVKYSKQYPYLPIAVGDNYHDLARILGISPSAVWHAIDNGSKRYAIVEDEPEMFPDNDGNLWYYDKDGNVVMVRDYET